MAGETGEGACEPIEGVAGGLGRGFLFEYACFHGPGAAETPVGRDHLLNEAVLHAIGRLEAPEVVVEDVLKALRQLTGQDDLAGEQAMLEGIVRRTPFAFGSDRTPGERAVGA